MPETYRRVSGATSSWNTNAGVAAGSIVLPGVTVGVNACVGAMTVVTRDVPDHAFVVGVRLDGSPERDPDKYKELMAAFWKSTNLGVDRDCHRPGPSGRCAIPAIRTGGTDAGVIVATGKNAILRPL